MNPSPNSYLWQDVSVTLDALGASSASTWYAPPEHMLQTRAAQFLRLSWEITAIPFGNDTGLAPNLNLEFETSDSPEPGNPLGSTTWNRAVQKSVATRGLSTGSTALTINTSGGVGLQEYVRIKLDNQADTVPLNVRLRVWVTITAG